MEIKLDVFLNVKDSYIFPINPDRNVISLNNNKNRIHWTLNEGTCFTVGNIDKEKKLENWKTMSNEMIQIK